VILNETETGILSSTSQLAAGGGTTTMHREINHNDVVIVGAAMQPLCNGVSNIFFSCDVLRLSILLVV